MKAFTRFFPLTLALFIIISSCTSIEPVKVTGIKDLSVIGKDANGWRIKVLVGVENPNNMRIKLRKADIEAIANGRSLGTFTLADNITIQKKSTEPIELEVYVQSKDLLKGGAGAILNTILSRKAEIELKGTIKVSAYGIRRKIPVHLKEEVPIPNLF